MKKKGNKEQNSTSMTNIFSFRKEKSGSTITSSPNLFSRSPSPKKTRRGAEKKAPPSPTNGGSPSNTPTRTTNNTQGLKTSTASLGSLDIGVGPPPKKEKEKGGDGAGGPVHPLLDPVKLKKLRLKGVMSDPLYSVAFEKFVKEEMEMENLMFWKHTQEYRKLPEDEREAKIEEIHELFLKPTSDFPLLATVVERESLQEAHGLDRMYESVESRVWMELSQSLRKFISSGRLAADVGEMLAEKEREEREEKERLKKMRKKKKKGMTVEGKEIIIPLEKAKHGFYPEEAVLTCLSSLGFSGPPSLLTTTLFKEIATVFITDNLGLQVINRIKLDKNQIMVCSVSIPLLADLIGGLKQFIIDALEMEMKTVGAQSVPFRSNSLHVKALTSSHLVISHRFLVELVYPVVEDVNNWAKDGIELDPSTTTLDPTAFEERKKVCQKEFIRTFHSLILSLYRYLIRYPAEGRFICRTLKTRLEMAGLSDSMRDTVVLGFFFLRFLCPGILSPVEYRVCTGTLTEPVKKTLMLLSKTLMAFTSKKMFRETSPEGYLCFINPEFELFSANRERVLECLLSKKRAQEIHEQWIEDGLFKAFPPELTAFNVACPFASFPYPNMRQGPTTPPQNEETNAKVVLEEREIVERVVDDKRKGFHFTYPPVAPPSPSPPGNFSAPLPPPISTDTVVLSPHRPPTLSSLPPPISPLAEGEGEGDGWGAYVEKWGGNQEDDEEGEGEEDDEGEEEHDDVQDYEEFLIQMEDEVKEEEKEEKPKEEEKPQEEEEEEEGAFSPGKFFDRSCHRALLTLFAYFLYHFRGNIAVSAEQVNLVEAFKQMPQLETQFKSVSESLKKPNP